MLRTGELSPDLGVSLAHAIVLASDTPLLLIGADATVMAASWSFCRSFGIDPAQAPLAPLSSLGHGEWDMPQLSVLLGAAASGFATGKNCEMDLRRQDYPAQRLLIAAQTLNYPSSEGPMVLLSITDVTEVRNRDHQKEVALQEKVVLLKELQHRMANSLQIIAGVLLQSARTAQSDEARSSIQAAHYRVMSVAALQHQLAGSQIEDVDLAVYVASLCRSIGASLIRDPSKVAIRLDVAPVFVKANVSLSLGLIVTELVINALKHAFPGDGGGTILVSYTAGGDRWTLTVRDDGVGMTPGAVRATQGQGSRIVTALAAQLGAVIAVSDASPGTVVSIGHTVTDRTSAPLLLAAV